MKSGKSSADVFSTRYVMGFVLACVFLGLIPVLEGRPGNGLVLRGQEVTSEGFFRFNFLAANGQMYDVQASSNLLNWVRLTNIAGAGELVWIEDRESGAYRTRYYHVGPRPVPITNMVFIPPGTFTMGSPQNEPGRSANEGPQTVVKISREFWIGKFEVIQSDYVELVGANHSTSDFDRRLPVNFVSWNQATNYCSKLTERERAAGRIPPGYVYRLPTEAEWEYACRAGTTTPMGIGSGVSLNSHQANFDGNFPYGGAIEGPYRFHSTLPGSFLANAWGLYDMHGNVAEWCQDTFGPLPGGTVTDPKGPAPGSNKVMKGGGYNSVGNGVRSARRDSRSQTIVNFPHGFRVVLAREL